MNKNVFFSKTMWYNIIWVLLILVNRFMLPVPMELLEPLATVSLPLGNMALRYLTTKGVSL